jgi:predicted nucleic acid-binding protein
VTRYLLDANIIGHAIKLSPPGALVQWMADQADEDLFIASLSLAEIRRGILQMPEGRKRRELEEWFSGLVGLRRCSGTGCSRSMNPQPSCGPS